MKTIIKTGLAATLGLAIAAPAFALDTGIKGLTQNGRIKVGASVLYDLPGQGDKFGPANWLIESKTTYRPSRNWSFVANFWLRGDAQKYITSYDAPQGGLTNPLDQTLGSNLNFNLNDKNCGFPLQCEEISDQLTVLNEWEDIIRELSVKYRDPKRRFTVKFGKFQRGWGQSDGLRLMDVLHAQDLRERFAFRDSDELRIPALMLSADFKLDKLGMAGPFEAMGMKRPVLEVNFVPEVHHSKFIINNPTPTDNGMQADGSGGIFGLPWPDTTDGPSGLGYVGFGFNTPENNADKLSFKDAEYSMRLKFEAWGGLATINAFYGMQDLPILKLRGLNLIVGASPNNLINDPTGASIVAPFSANDTEAIVHGAGGYLDFLRDLTATGGANVANPLSVATQVFFGGGGPGNVCFDGANAPATTAFNGNTGTAFCSVNADVELDYDYRQKLVGFTFTRDLSDFMQFGRKNSSPSMRFEIAHEFDKPFNRSNVAPEATPSFAGELPPGALDANIDIGYDQAGGEQAFGALAVIPSRGVTKSNVTSTMIGFDFPFWVPGWETQQRSIFTSLQIFDIYTHQSDKGLMVQAPYGFTTVEDHQNYMTFLWSAPLDNQRLVLEGLLIEDLTNDSTFYRQRVDFNYFGDSWRPRLEWMHFDAKKESVPLGLLNNSDFIELSLTYQF
ncbi:MAG: hypothetical protein ACPHPA_01055 [Cycloclasticus pugetii]|uniref:hypothetical protein n=1 Tax=Cycloclasticus pugetii TaxID=34068 RepID=UPI003A8D2FAD